jgi:hypothetical protein
VVVPVRTVQEAVVAEDLPPLDADAAHVFSLGERILQDHFRRYNTSAAELKDLTQRLISQGRLGPGEPAGLGARESAGVSPSNRQEEAAPGAGSFPRGRTVLHHPDFNADDIDHNMRESLMRAVEEGYIEVIDMWEDGDGSQDNTLNTPPPPRGGIGAAAAG